MVLTLGAWTFSPPGRSLRTSAFCLCRLRRTTVLFILKPPMCASAISLARVGLISRLGNSNSITSSPKSESWAFRTMAVSIRCTTSSRGGERSGERRVGEEGRSRGAPGHLKKKKKIRSQESMMALLTRGDHSQCTRKLYLYIFPLSSLSLALSRSCERPLTQHHRLRL